jgi:hypothetical protein
MIGFVLSDGAANWVRFFDRFVPSAIGDIPPLAASRPAIALDDWLCFVG